MLKPAVVRVISSKCKATVEVIKDVTKAVFPLSVGITGPPMRVEENMVDAKAAYVHEDILIFNNLNVVSMKKINKASFIETSIARKKRYIKESVYTSGYKMYVAVRKRNA